MPKQPTISLRQHLASLLGAKGAHLRFEAAVTGFPAHLRGAKPPGAPHSAWQLIEHMRIAQRDILDSSRNPACEVKNLPGDNWPAADNPPSEGAWDASVRQYQSDLKELQELLADTKNDLLAPIPQGKGQTLLREALMVADHTAYHLGQLVLLRKILEA